MEPNETTNKDDVVVHTDSENDGLPPIEHEKIDTLPESDIEQTNSENEEIKAKTQKELEDLLN